LKLKRKGEKLVKAVDRFLLQQLERFVQREGRKFLDLQEGFKPTYLSPLRGAPSITSLYVHIPFCRQLCPYCSFNRVAYEESLARAYFDALKKELSFYAERSYAFTHLYMGGGTPTVDMPLLKDLLIEIKRLFPIQQISIEANPADLTASLVVELQACGIHRLSMGVQSFQDDMLKAMGRLSHTGDLAMQSIERVRGRFDTVNIDLMYNFPSQSTASFLQDIRCFKSLDIEQVTFYPLMPSPHKKTALERRFQKVDPSREFEFYQLLLDEMLPTYHASTSWCFSKGERLIDEYIIEVDDYAGLGAGSIGFIDGIFLVNAFRPQRYIDLVLQGQIPIVYHKESSKRDHARYQMLTRLFGMKWDWEKHQEQFGKVLWSEVAMLKAAGIVTKKENILVPTRKGMYYVSIMMKNFFATLNRLREECISSGI
jgi:menaquinone C8-methyltransferase